MFDRALSATTNVDTISDFANASGSNDRIFLDDAVFGALKAGALAAGAFMANATGMATQPDERIIYETNTGSCSTAATARRQAVPCSLPR